MITIVTFVSGWFSGGYFRHIDTPCADARPYKNRRNALRALRNEGFVTEIRGQLVFRKEDSLRILVAVLVPAGEDPIRHAVRMTGLKIRNSE